MRAARRTPISESWHLVSAAGATALQVRAARKAAGVLPSFKRVDTCAAEFAAETPYLYSSYDGSDESRSSSAKKVCSLKGPSEMVTWLY